jgi:hypothetical protein
MVAFVFLAIRFPSASLCVVSVTASAEYGAFLTTAAVETERLRGHIFKRLRAADDSGRSAMPENHGLRRFLRESQS